jgi:hypothetical protein
MMRDCEGEGEGSLTVSLDGIRYLGLDLKPILKNTWK